MKQFIPTIYVSSVFQIPYQKLKEKQIRCLVFDLDNTIACIDQPSSEEPFYLLCQELKRDFSIFLLTNNHQKRLTPYLDQLGIEGMAWAFKPSVRGLKKIQTRYGFLKEEMVMIGDQLMTDILAGNRFQIMTILVDPLAVKDLKITKINRLLESRVLHSLSKKDILRRGKYYE